MKRLLVAALLIGSSVFARAEPSGEPITFGITPQNAPGELGKLWVPIFRYLGKKSGYQIQFKTSKDVNTFWKDSAEGAFDMIYINPYQYTKARASAGYLVFVKDDGAPLTGVLVVRKDGPRRIEELQGQKLAVPDTSSLVATYIAREYLQKQHVHVVPVAVGSHDSVIRTVEKGLFPAGVVNLRIFGMLDLSTQQNFRVLLKSDPLPPFAFAAHPRVNPTALVRIRQAMLEMDGDAEGRLLLAAINVKAMVAAKDHEYDAVRKLKLD